MEGVLGMRVLRHEEFNQGCEATCNGPYARPWSKTMIGFGEELNSFVFELTYNYGIHKYRQGNDLRHVEVVLDETWNPPKEYAYSFENGVYSIIGPDNVVWKVILKKKIPKVSKLSLNVKSLEQSKSFYVDSLSMYVKSQSQHILQLKWREEELTSIELVELKGDKAEEVRHEEAFGRIAIACPDVHSIHKIIQSIKGNVKHGPIKLETSGKATVEVIIVEDCDEYEICFVESSGFNSLSSPIHGAEIIDWKVRSELGADST
jgi:catechol 2,3-dioxygenase-like lactoylglutathione lyase family enzyme